MISKVDICNLALTYIGQKTITSLDEPSENARRASLLFATALDSVLRAHNWNFAGKIEALAEIAGEPVLGWAYLYKYPSKCLFVRKIFNQDTLNDAEPQQFKELLSSTTNQKAIATNLKPAYAEITVQVTDPNLYDSLFVKALAYNMASELAQPLCGDSVLGEKMAGYYTKVIEQAKTSNAAEGNYTPQITSSYEDAR